MSPDASTKIREFVSNRYPGTPIDDSQDIFESGPASSRFAVELMRFLESEFGIRVPSRDMNMRTFATVESMTRLVLRETA